MGENFETDDEINKLLIKQVKERPALHNTDTYTESQEKQWDEIQTNLGIQKSWLKKRWKTLQNEHRKIILYNHIHSKKLPLHKMANHLAFLSVDLNGANDMNFDDLKQAKVAKFCVTQEMIDKCEISELTTADTITMPKLQHTVIDEPTNRSDKSLANDNSGDTAVLKKTNETESNSSKRCEDTIFGEWVAEKLKKMTPEDKKRAQKDIMNILL